MEVYGNVNKACRLCLNGEGRISVFEEENTKLSITPESIYDCVSVKITKDDRLPTGICESCLSSVESWCSFKNTCEKAQEKLIGWFNDNRLDAVFEEEEISVKKEAKHNKPHVDSPVINHLTSNLTLENLLESKVDFGVDSNDTIENVFSINIEKSTPHDRTEEITNTFGEEENKKASFVSSTKENEDSTPNITTSNDDIVCNTSNHYAQQINNLGSYRISGDSALCNEILDDIQDKGVSTGEPMEVSSIVVDKTIDSDKLFSREMNDSSSLINNSDEASKESLVLSAELVNEKDSVNKVNSTEMDTRMCNITDTECVSTAGINNCLDVRLSRVSQNVQQSSGFSYVNVDPTDAFNDKSNEESNNKLLEVDVTPGTTTVLPPKEIKLPTNEPSPDSDKENFIPNSVTHITDSSKEKQLTNSDSTEQSVEGDQPNSFSEILIESVSTLTTESSEFFSSQDAKQNAEKIVSPENVENIAVRDTDESSAFTLSDQTESAKEMIAVEEANEMGNSSKELNIPSSDLDNEMEVDYTEMNMHEQVIHERRTDTEKDDQFSQVLIQNIKQEPVDDTHEIIPSASTHDMFPIRVKSEFGTFDYDEYTENEPSVSGEETNKCDVCNRKYSSLSNYLKHLQTKVHMYNASLVSGDNSMPLPGDASTSNYLGDPMSSYSNDSYSEDSRLSAYSSDSPMLRSRLCADDFVQASTNRIPHAHFARQAVPKIPYPSSLSKLPKKREKCKLCNTTFTYISEMRRHLLSKKHKDNERILRDNERMMLENERMIKDNVKMFKDKVRYMRDRALMLKQDDTSTTQLDKNQLPFICPIENCHYSCQKGHRLLAHMRTHGIGQPAAPPQPQFSTEKSMPKPKLSLRQQDLLKKELEKRKASIAAENVVVEPLLHDYKCDGCEKTFLRESGLKKHSYYCSALKVEQQDEDEEDEEEEQQPKISENSIDNLQINKMHCPICNLTFAAKSVFIQHVQIYHKGSTLESGLFRPKKTIMTSNKLRVKSKKGHSYVCNHCGKKFNLLSSLNFHLKVHSTKHVCKICKKGYDSRRAFMDHCRLHFLPPGSKQTLCHKCFRVFKTRGEFYHHRKNDMCTIKLKIYTCNICQHSFKDPTALEEHKIRSHNDLFDNSDGEISPSADHEPKVQNYLSMNNQNFEIEDENCPSTSSKSNFMNITQSVNQPKVDLLLHCDVCDRDYATLSSLKKHMWKYHQTKPLLLTRRIDVTKNNSLHVNAPKCWKCKHCKKVFNTRRMLVVHLKKCKYNAFELEHGMCLQCGKWCESGKSRICRFCLPDMSKIPKAKKNLSDSSNYSVTPKVEFTAIPMQEVNSDPRMAKYIPGSIPNTAAPGGGIRLMKCPVGNKYFRSELLMIKHYSQCDGSCENRCSHCRKFFNTPKEYRVHLLNSNCYKSSRTKTNGKKLAVRPKGNYSESDYSEIETFSSKNSDELEISQEMNVDSFSEENSIMDLESGLTNDPNNKIVEEKSIKMGRVCTICNKVITMQRGVYRHVYGCFKISMLTQESVSCKKCSRTFSKHISMKENTAAIRQHILDCHFIPYYEGEGLTEDGSFCEIPPSLLCYVCSFGFSSNERLKKHIMEHRSRKDEINNVVLLLEAELLSERRLTSDTASYHIQIRPESSETLTSQPVRKKNVLSFKVPGSQSMESQKIVRKKVLQCEKCSRKFTNRNKFLRHKKVHGIVTQSVFHEVSENYLDFIADHTPPSSN